MFSMQIQLGWIKWLVLPAALLMTTTVWADKVRYKPFILAKTAQSDLATAVQEAKKNLQAGQFQVVGEVTPYDNTHILIVTHPELLTQAAKSEFGAFGAAQRVTLTRVDNQVQVSFTNPTYLAHAYRMQSDLSTISAGLKQALGYVREYGHDKGLTGEDLRDYQYKWLMPYFDDRLELARYKSQQEAISRVTKVMTKSGNTVNKVYQIDLPGKDETVIGVQLKGKNNDDCSSDHYIMSRIDFDKTKSSAHLPYEVVIKNGKVYTLPAEFRIAISFPGLSMMGSNSFASIMCAPDSIKSTLTKAVGGTQEEEF